MNHLVHIAEALSRPLLMHPTKLEIILGVISDRLPGLDLQSVPLSPDASRFAGSREGNRPYRTQAGIALIPIIGSLANRGAYIGASSGITSYEGIGAQIRMAADDPAVHSIVLDIDSPGGEATGMFRLADLIRQIRASKHVVAFVDDMAASAAYGIASQAHEIIVSPSSIVGSIGVVLTHVDRSVEMEKAGRRVTLIHAGAHKVDGHPFGPLSAAVREELQAQVHAFYSQFLAIVAAGRPRLSLEAARATEARTFIGQAAVNAGLADRIGTLDSVVADLSSSRAATPRRSHPQPVGSAMSSNPSAAPYVATSTMPWPDALVPAAAPIPAQVVEKPNGLWLAVDEMIRRDAGLRPSPPVGSAPRLGLAAAMDELIAEDQRRASAGAGREHQPSPWGGLAGAIDEVIEQHARHGR